MADGAARSLLATLLAACAFAGCRSLPPPPDHSDLDAEAARRFVREQALAVKDFTAQVTLAVESPDFSGSLDGALVVEPPARLRLRTTKMMQDVFDLVMTPQLLELYWFRDNILYRRTPAGLPPAAAALRAIEEQGRDTRASAFLRTLDPATFRASLSAFELPAVDATPRSPWQERAATETFERTRGAFVVVDALESGGRLTRTFDGSSLLLRAARLDDVVGRPQIEASYGGYRPVGGLWLPSESKLVDHRFGVAFTMELSDVAVNEGALSGAFELHAPSDATVREIE